jgi:hypothetical protein
VKFSLDLNGKHTTYDPDFFSPSEDCYIEVATSENNIATQGVKWRASIRAGDKLKVYWWEGNDITAQFKS